MRSMSRLDRLLVAYDYRRRFFYGAMAVIMAFFAIGDYIEHAGLQLGFDIIGASYWTWMIINIEGNDRNENRT